MGVDATLSLEKAAGVPWDVIVVGAGPAGGMSALLMARRGKRVLLVERSAFPREKVCGCCLAGSGVDLLDRVGVSLVGAARLERARFRTEAGSSTVRLEDSIAISRSQLDGAIVDAAIAAGAEFIPQCSGHLREGGLWLAQAGVRVPVAAAIVLACDGIRGTLLDAIPECRWEVAEDAWMGAALTIDEAVAAPGEVVMHIA